jgi:hypothetical protein
MRNKKFLKNLSKNSHLVITQAALLRNSTLMEIQYNFTNGLKLNIAFCLQLSSITQLIDIGVSLTKLLTWWPKLCSFKRL